MFILTCNVCVQEMEEEEMDAFTNKFKYVQLNSAVLYNIIRLYVCLLLHLYYIQKSKTSQETFVWHTSIQRSIFVLW